jgi:hypothetical protein
VKSGREGPTIPVQLHGGLRSHNRIVTPAGTTTVHMVGGAACIDNAPNTSSMAMSRTFHCRTSQGRPSRGLYSHHTRSHCIDDPLDTGSYIQQDNIQFYHTTNDVPRSEHDALVILSSFYHIYFILIISLT